MNIDTKEVQTILDWTKDQVHLHATSIIGKHAKPKRGQVFRCKFGVGVGSELQKIRPAVVISEHINNQNSEIIVVAPITHTHKNLPSIVGIERKLDSEGNIILDGYVNVTATRSVSAFRLCGYICDLDKSEIKAIDTALARHLEYFFITIVQMNRPRVFVQYLRYRRHRHKYRQSRRFDPHSLLHRN